MRATESPSESAYWILRIGAALCFIGHGAFGFITKAAWLPYFAVMGIPERWAWKMMPIVGAIDVTAGMAVLFAPRGLPLVYMSVWALFTALLRPVAGEGVLESFERAGNYGVPMALLAMTSMPRSVRALLDPREIPSIDANMIERVTAVLKWTTVLLLGAHGLIGVVGKATLATHYGALGLPSGITPIVGWFEVALAAVIAVRPTPGLLMFVAAWKVATESLFIVAGAPVWEVVERAGSFAAPLALAALMHRFNQVRRSASANRPRTSDCDVARSSL
ncbi:MAG: hypothetical protein ABI969_13055 [bacterium]